MGTLAVLTQASCSTSGLPPLSRIAFKVPNVDLGPNLEFLRILGRGYPRATPGRIVSLTSDPDTGLLRIDANADRPGGELVVWTPTVDGPDHRVHTVGLVDVVEHAVPGGRLVTATVAAPGDYALWIGPGEDQPIDPAPTSAPAPTSIVTTPPPSARPSYTG